MSAPKVNATVPLRVRIKKITRAQFFMALGHPTY